ncbi:Hpt domain-containing protein [Actimicrobium sp. CCC2.4]|uniref:hybrid sensor histidine kinase/response regulator n=1 Tax=Actimicrobium sp. CCC2.4 TaxID=3048606 RepID=UPI002AC9330F|nr:Hpt domain-containing protein [Actimicrobium sp. CCC2.4]MEB0136733.1 Hpt domain-containing protein [Actimicrobium sp. CCC2.4]WPX33195.1 Hpt domain-containing protein [Actimicrobium sp. CCC2.4]
MSSPISVTAPGVRDNFDAGSLSWIMAEIREALDQSRTALIEAIRQDDDARPTTLRHARAFLHQAHGALQIVDIEGVTILTETAEDLLERMESGQVPASPQAGQVLDNAYQALLGYLDELLAGVPQQPVRLFPYYRALLELRGAERIHPADLFFPNLAVRPQPVLVRVAGAAPVDYAKLRKRFEMALLPFLKKTAEPALASVAEMLDIIALVEQAQLTPQARNFWWVLRAFAEGVATSQIPAELYVKQLFARINLQIRRLSEGSASIAERLLRDALFFIARIERPSPLAQQVRAAYDLAGRVPQDYARPRYSAVDSDALEQAREHLLHAKQLWNRLAAGDASVAAAFEADTHHLAEAGTRLGAPALAKFLREFNGIARHAAHSRPGDQLGLDVATGLLFIDNALTNLGSLDEGFATRADALSARLLSLVAGEEPPDAGGWLDDMSRQAQQRQTMAALAGEMQSNLRQVEKTLEDYFRDPRQRAGLPSLQPVLHQIGGALAVLDQQDATRAVRHIERAVQAFADLPGDAAPEAAACSAVAQNIGALSFFIETLQLHSDAARGHFSFDDEQGIFRAALTGKKPAPERAPAHDAGLPVQPDHDLAQANLSAVLADISLDFADIPAVPEDVTVEQEMRQHQQQCADLAVALVERPDDPALQEKLRSVLQQVQRDARLLDHPEAGERASAAIALLAQADFVASSGALVSLLPGGAALPVAPAIPAPQTKAAVDAELLEIFLAEAGEVLDAVRTTLPQLQANPQDNFHLASLRRGFHTLKGSGRMVGLDAFGNAAWSIEQVLNRHVADEKGATPEVLGLIGQAGQLLTAWVGELSTDGHSGHDGLALIDAAQRLLDGAPLRLDVPAAGEEPIAPVVEPEATAAPVTAVGSAEVIAFPGTTVPVRDDNVRRIGDLEISVTLHSIYLAETDDLVRLLSHDLDEWRHEPERRVSVHAVHAAHSLAGSSATVGFKAMQELAHGLEDILQLLARKTVVLEAADFDRIAQCLVLMKGMLQEFALGDLPLPQPVQLNLLIALLHELDARAAVVVALPGADEPDGAVAGPEAELEELLQPALLPMPVTAAVIDELDADLLPIFLEEGRDMLPQMGTALRGWQNELTSTALPQSVLRLLHTIKGSARMAGAMQLGQYLHDTESQIETLLHVGQPHHAALDALLARHDHSLHLFDLLQNPAVAPVDEVPMPERAVPAGLSPPETVTPALSAAATGTATMVRVRADILDRLVNQAGEVSISRSRLETEVGTLRQSLSELTDNVARLRDQLREIELQADSQITSRRALSPDGEFDPLEFDRYTRLQELTRMMAESVSDVASVQQNLTRTVDEASVELVSQARLTRELQQDLMRVRMVPFSSIAERLYRVTRQVSKEVDKRVNLDIRGGNVEIDRGVLEKMAGPFEHLLRNAIVHGIEHREQRRAAGKNETGELRVEIRQEGNEVVLQFSDDGGGLDLQRIRSKALATGLLAPGRELAEAELTDLIFNPGFSTVVEVTELAGRGIGMDVVRAEAGSLGGRVAIATQAGQGAHFTIHLPLTLAVTQVVVLRTGDKIYAVPSVLVEQVQQLKATALASAYSDGAIQWQGQRVPLFYLPTLLGDRQTIAVTQQYAPVIILRSGNDRVAIHVDDIQGNREVVVKNIGPQLARMVGIAGATVLGSGEIILILNPVPLAQRALLETARLPLLDNIGTVADARQPVQGLRAQSIVMVVDDSLTVRRVTQRLLAREGFQVVLAKDGIDALEQLQSITPDIMLVDIEMPRMDGFDLTRNVRGDERTRAIPIIMITSRTAAKHRNYAMELGVDAYLGKPYQEADLLGEIREFLGRKVSGG